MKSYVTRVVVPLVVVVIAFIIISWIKMKLFPRTKSLIEFNLLNNGHSTVPLDLTFHGVIGHGSFATVYKGRYDKKTVAIKVMQFEKHKRWDIEKDILYECNGHNNVIKILGAEIRESRQGKLLCLILEYAEYGNLRTYLSKNCINLKKCLHFIKTLNLGISYIHADWTNTNKRKTLVVHRDIKSANILLSGKKGCILADFGLASKVDFDYDRRSDILKNVQVSTVLFRNHSILANPHHIILANPHHSILANPQHSILANPHHSILANPNLQS